MGGLHRWSRRGSRAQAGGLRSEIVRAGVDCLHDRYVAGLEACLAVFEVVVPSPDKGLIEAEFLDAIEFFVKRLVPFGQGSGIVESHVLKIVEEKIASFSEHFVYTTHAEEEGAGEDDFLNPIDAFCQRFVAAIGNCDILDS